MSLSDWWDEWGEILGPAGIGVAIIGGLIGLAFWLVSSDEKKEKERQRLTDTSVNVQTIDSLAAMADTAGRSDTAKKTYILDSLDLAKIADTNKVQQDQNSARYTKYGGVEVHSLEKFMNARLIGVAQYDIQFSQGDVMKTYPANGLLFELDSSKLLNLVAPYSPFYTGQRYNIEYHRFKEGAHVSGENLLNMFIKGKDMESSIGTDHGRRYDGVLVGSELVRKNQQVKK